MRRRVGEFKSAEDLARKALSIAPELPEAHAMMALVLCDQEKQRDAGDAIATALEYDPDDPFVRYVAGLVALKRRDFLGSKAHFEAALALDQEDPVHYVGLATVYWNMDKDKKAHELIDQARAIDPENLCVAILRTEILLEQGRIKEAESEAEHALGIAPEDPDACFMMAKIRLRQNRIAEAKEHAVYALMKNPRDQDVLTTLVWIKSRENPFMAVWWRLYPWMHLRMKSQIVAYFLFFFLLVLLKHSIADSTIKTVVGSGIIGFAAVICLGYAAIEVMIKRELKAAKISADF